MEAISDDHLIAAPRARHLKSSSVGIHEFQLLDRDDEPRIIRSHPVRPVCRILHHKTFVGKRDSRPVLDAALAGSTYCVKSDNFIGIEPIKLHTVESDIVTKSDDRVLQPIELVSIGLHQQLSA